MINAHIETILVVTGLATALTIGPVRGATPTTTRVKALAVIDTGIAVLYLTYFGGL